jgi:hypothetical protein
LNCDYPSDPYGEDSYSWYKDIFIKLKEISKKTDDTVTSRISPKGDIEVLIRAREFDEKFEETSYYTGTGKTFVIAAINAIRMYDVNFNNEMNAWDRSWPCGSFPDAKDITELKYENTLYYYDGPQIIEAVDIYNRHYIGCLLHPDQVPDEYKDKETFVITGVSNSSLAAFKKSKKDLLSTLLYRITSIWFLGTLGTEEGIPKISLTKQRYCDLHTSEFLPDAGFYLNRD